MFCIRAAICVILLSSSLSAQSIWQISPCSDSVGKKKLLGERLRLPPPSGAPIRQAHDHDYAEYYLGFGKGNRRVWMNGIYGPNATGGDTWRNLGTEKSGVSNVDGISIVDIRGRKTDGTYWRFLGTYGERILYTDVPKEAAEYFDKVLDVACYLSWDRMHKK